MLYIRVNFPDDLTQPNSETSAYSTMDAVNAFFVECSYNQTWLNTKVTPLLTVPQLKAYYSTAGPGALADDARDAARKAGFEPGNYNRIIVSHTTVPGYDWGGLAGVGGSQTWLQSYGLGVTAHELGHNEGFLHANFWQPAAASTGTDGPGANIEYGNIYDTMGSGGGQFGTLFKAQAGWLPDTAIHAITTNGVYRLYPCDVAARTPGRFYAANVRKDFARDYWLEFRNRPTDASTRAGLLLNWSPWTGSDGGPQLLDTTPATASRNDSAVVIGRTFSDRLAGVHITPLSRGATGTDPWIEVEVNVDNGARNLPCCLKVETLPTNAATGQLVRFHATVADRDDNSFAYAWTFDDGTFSTNNSPWAYKSWADSGEHVVRCEVSDKRGGRASANTVVTVGTPSGFRVSGVVLDATGRPLEDVLIQTDDNVYGFTDSDGAFILTGLNGNVAITAAKYGYTFESSGWQSPLNVTTNLARVDFRATALTNVSLVLSTNFLAESSGTTNTLELIRSVTDTNDLTVTLVVAGTADLTSDLAFTPPLVPGTNTVVIPEIGRAHV